MIIDKIINDVKSWKKNIQLVFPEGSNQNIQEAAKTLKNEGNIEPILIFSKKSEIPNDLKNIKTIAIDSINLEPYIQLLYDLRKEKGLTLDQAKQLVRRTNYLGSLMVKMNEANGEVCGVDYTTKDTLLPALQIIKTASDYKIVSSAIIMTKNNETLLFGDCAINLNPNEMQLSEIARALISCAHNLLEFNEVRAALLSYSSNGSGQGPDVEKVSKAFKLLKPIINNKTKIFGEIQFDAAYKLMIMNKKVKTLNWTNSANVFVFPTLNAGNIGYKIAQYMGDYQAIGPILLGLNAPVNDLSRGASVSDIIKLSYITAAQYIANLKGDK